MEDNPTPCSGRLRGKTVGQPYKLAIKGRLKRLRLSYTTDFLLSFEGEGD